MIIDSLKGFERYLNLHPRFSKVFQFLNKTELEKLEVGTHSILAKEIFCTIWEGEGVGVEIPKLEVHDSYIDIQIVIEGYETIAHRDRASCDGEGVEYDSENDKAYLEESPTNFVNLSPGNFAILFPHDAHAPLIGEGRIKKAIIKVLM